MLAVFVLPAVHHFQHQREGTHGACCREHAPASPPESRGSLAANEQGGSLSGWPASQFGRAPTAAHGKHACAICQAFQAKQIAAVAILAVGRGEAHSISQSPERTRLAHGIIGSASPRGPPRILV